MSINAPVPEDGFNAYIRKIGKFPMISELEEKELVKDWINSKDVVAAHKLVTSHLRLVVKIAFQFRNYGFSLMELVAEGTVGLMKAVKNFDPNAGSRVATYAMWWIKSAIQEYILKSWSLVKIGTTTAQRKLFFNLRRLQRQPLTNSQIAEQLSVSESELGEMDNTLSNNNYSLDNESYICDEISLQENSQVKDYVEQEHFSHNRSMLLEAINSLDERYREILIARRLRDTPSTLHTLGRLYNISSERVRQIEMQAMKKVKQIMVAKQQQ